MITIVTINIHQNGEMNSKSSVIVNSQCYVIIGDLKNIFFNIYLLKYLLTFQTRRINYIMKKQDYPGKTNAKKGNDSYKIKHSI